MGSVAEWLLDIAALVFAGGGVWTWMQNSRAATSGEYKLFAEDMRQERRDREAAIKELRLLIKDQDTRIHNQALTLADLEIHVERLEAVIENMGGTPPPRPVKRTVVSPPPQQDPKAS